MCRIACYAAQDTATFAAKPSERDAIIRLLQFWRCHVKALLGGCPETAPDCAALLADWLAQLQRHMQT